MAQKKERLDKLLMTRGLVPTRAKAQAVIMAGEVRVDGEVRLKAGMKVGVNAGISLSQTMPYVSRGGYKLAAALDEFELNVTDLICADVGACTGGFSDVLLQRGAAKVYAIDVGYGQLAWKIRQNKRVAVMERTNARYLEQLDDPLDLAVIDVSFISLRLILPAVQKWLKPTGDIIALIKPQFEAGRKQVGKGGIVKESAVHRQVLEDMVAWCRQNELTPLGLIQSPLKGSAGNIEFLLWLQPHAQSGFDSKLAIKNLLQINLNSN